jgi:RimJ/RimL family protein N-acetyltransferase
MSPQIIFGEDEAAGKWAGEVLATVFHPPFTTMAVKDAGEFCGVLLFNDYNGANIELNAAGKWCWTPEVVQAGFDYVFKQLPCVRLTARTRRKNRLVRKLLPRLGFRFEGVQRLYYGDDDALVFGLLKTECRFL